MFKVLLVDDEPIILTGIKFMINWQELDCNLIATAENGKEALELIEVYQPDIVIADIKMPVMNGIELLEETSNKYPHIAFIMLTNLEEFELAQKAIKLRAVSYIIKIRLEAKDLIEAIEVAKEHSMQRQTISNAFVSDNMLKEVQSNVLNDAIKTVVLLERYSQEAINVLNNNLALRVYGIIELFLPCDYNTDKNEKARLFNWMIELVRKMTQNIFTNYVLLEKDYSCYLYVWFDDDNSFFEKSKSFKSRFSSLTSNIIGIEGIMLKTDSFSGGNNLAMAVEQIKFCATDYYNTGTKYISGESIKNKIIDPMPISGFENKFRSNINNRNIQATTVLIDRLSEMVADRYHEKQQAQWICNELINISTNYLDDSDNSLEDVSDEYYKIENFQNKKQVLLWLENLKLKLELSLLPLNSQRSNLIERVKQYVEDNIDRKIFLNEVAEHIGISPSYLSALFKEEYGENFVDYVNETKIEEAKKFITQSDYRMNEIGFMLGFENAYYFSKVFRKHTGLSPTEFKSTFNATEN